MDSFAALAAQFDFAPVPTVGMDGTPVIIDRTLGDEFVSHALAEHEAIMEGFGILTGQPLSDRALARLQTQLDRLPRMAGAAIQFNGLVGVNGQGLVMTKAYGQESYDVEVLTPRANLFGYFEGLAYGDYPYAKGIETLPPQTDVELPVLNREGLTMVLSSVMLCTAEEPYGFLQDKYEFTLVPIAEPGIAIHKAIAA
jgi:hypothetical protein